MAYSYSVARDESTEVLRAKFMGLHLGLLDLCVNDLGHLFRICDDDFKAYAQSVPEFQALSKEDQDCLILSNSPLFYQYRLSRYFGQTESGYHQFHELFGEDSELSAVLDHVSHNLLVISVR